MKETKKEIENAIIVVGELLGIEEETKLLLTNIGVHSTIKELTYQMFLQNKQRFEDANFFEAISLIKEYCEEMSENGEVKFG